MGKNNSRKHQKMYKMKGCSRRTRKHHLGGSSDAPLAYTGAPVQTVPNPFLAYTGKGGSSCGLSIPATQTVNLNASNPAYPNSGPVPRGDIFLNPSMPQHGGCNCGLPIFSGGKRSRKSRKGGCGPLCAMGFMVAGAKHRIGCKCSECKKSMKGGNAGIPYPNGLVGSPINAGNINDLPGVNGIPGDRNYYPLNTYNNDISRQMVDLGANPPFLGKGGSKKRKQKGGSFSNFMSQDLINLGRQFQFGIGSAYNALAGYQAPVNPLPWRDQLPSKPLNPAII